MGWTWQDSERLAASWMRSHGFRDARLTVAGADGGIDVVASEALAQVKYERKPVGRPPIQRLVGARGRKHGLELLFFSSSGYSPAAIAYADQMGIALLTYTPGGRVTPVNPAARRVAGRASNERRKADRERSKDPARRAREAARVAERQRRAADLKVGELNRLKGRTAGSASLTSKERQQERDLAKAATRAAKAAARAEKQAAKAASRAVKRRAKTTT